MNTDALGYYKILNVHLDATTEEIKNSYRELAKFWHPDRNTAPEAIENFQKLSEAWEILENEDARLIYDLLSSVYNCNNYPEIENISPYGNGKINMLV